MKYLSFALMLLCSFCWSQNDRSFTILKKNYSYSFNEAKREFSICHIDGNTSNCRKFDLKEISNNDFKMPNKIKEETSNYFNSQEFNVLGIKKILKEFDELEFRNFKTQIDFSKLIDDNNSNDTLKLSEALKNQYLQINKKNDTTYNFSYPDEKPSLDLSFEINFSEDVNEKQDLFQKIVNDSLLKSLTNNKERIVKEFSDYIKKEFESNLNEFYNQKISKSADYSFLTTQELFKNGQSSKETFIFYSLIKNDLFHIKVIESDSINNIKIYDNFNLEVKEPEFIKNFHKRFNQFEVNEHNNSALSRIYLMLKIPLEKKIESLKKKEFDNELSKVIDSIQNEKETFSGKFVLNKKIRVREISKVGIFKHNEYLNNYKDFVIKEASIRLFNNRVDRLVIVGKLANEDKTRVLINRNYSLPIREFNHRKQTNFFRTENNKTYQYNYDDVLDYLPNSKYNYAVKNDEFKIMAGDTIKAKERKLADYFTGIFFSDFLGLNSNNNNNLIIAEGRMRLPWNFRNNKVQTYFDNITAYVSVNLFSGFESSSRKVELESITVESEEDFSEKDQDFTTDNFNLLLNNNIDAGIQITPFTLEWRGASTFLHFRYGIRFLRSGVEYDLFRRDSMTVDSITTVSNNFIEKRSFQIYSLGHEAELNFEIRPQINLGADLTLGLNWLRPTGTNKNDLNFMSSNNTPNLKVLANIYSLTNPSNSKAGVFFRLGGHYNLGNERFFPQVMVGYATNLTSFVNKLQSNKK